MLNSEWGIRNGRERGCCYFRQPLSRHAATAPRSGSLLVSASTAQKLSPQVVPPQSRLTPCQLPRKRWSLLVRFTNSYIKPALKGEVAMSDSELTEGLHRGFAIFVNPSVAMRRQLPVRGAFWFVQAPSKSCPRKLFPLSHGLRRASSPASGGAFWCALQTPTQSLPVEGGGFRAAKDGGSQY